MIENVQFELSFYGGKATEAKIDLYDVSVALAGFHRSLALTTHLVLHDEIIIQAPGLKGAAIYASVPEDGSWKLPAVLAISASSIYAVGTAPKDTPLGHLVYSAYDYVVQQSLGFHVNYDESLGEQYEKYKKENPKIPVIKEYRLDSVIEKVENSIKDIHRPIQGKGTASSARISSSIGEKPLNKIGNDFTMDTYEYVRQSIRSVSAVKMVGRVSSYNSNTYRGRMFVPQLGFSVPFSLNPLARGSIAISMITSSLVANSQREETDTDNEVGLIHFNAFKNSSKNGRVKSLDIVEVFVSST